MARLAAAIVLLTLALPAAVAGAADPAPPQALFAKKLLADSRTTSAVKRLLRTGGGFVDAHTQFADLTGDARSDAVITVRSPGAAGAVAVYLFSTDGAKGAADGELRIVFRSQELYRATTLLRPGALVLRTPIFGLDDDLCCASKLLERDYRWNAGRSAFVRTDLREIEIG
jgi:hypothetical protein